MTANFDPLVLFKIRKTDVRNPKINEDVKNIGFRASVGKMLNNNNIDNMVSNVLYNHPPFLNTLREKENIIEKINHILVDYVNMKFKCLYDESVELDAKQPLIVFQKIISGFPRLSDDQRIATFTGDGKSSGLLEFNENISEGDLKNLLNQIINYSQKMNHILSGKEIQSFIDVPYQDDVDEAYFVWRTIFNCGKNLYKTPYLFSHKYETHIQDENIILQ